MEPRSWFRMIVVVLGLQLAGHVFVGNLFDLGYGGLFTIPLLLFLSACIAAVTDITDDEGKARRWNAWLHWYPTSLPNDQRFLFQEQQLARNSARIAIFAALCLAAACAAMVVTTLMSKEVYVFLAIVIGMALLVIDWKHGKGPRR